MTHLYELTALQIAALCSGSFVLGMAFFGVLFVTGAFDDGESNGNG